MVFWASWHPGFSSSRNVILMYILSFASDFMQSNLLVLWIATLIRIRTNCCNEKEQHESYQYHCLVDGNTLSSWPIFGYFSYDVFNKYSHLSKYVRKNDIWHTILIMTNNTFKRFFGWNSLLVLSCSWKSSATYSGLFWEDFSLGGPNSSGHSGFTTMQQHTFSIALAVRMKSN